MRYNKSMADKDAVWAELRFLVENLVRYGEVKEIVVQDGVPIRVDWKSSIKLGTGDVYRLVGRPG